MSQTFDRATRLVLALVVLLALATLGLRYRATEVGDEGDSLVRGDRRPGRRAWELSVDGWRIEVDGAALSPPEIADLPEVDGEVADLRLEKLALFADSIGRYATEENFDWRLVAAVIAEESGFRPNAMSRAGAFGLMQVKEDAARQVGVFPYDDPDSNIRAGVRYLSAMREAFPAPGRRDGHAMMLAAYNMGPGHLHDAQMLARELGLPVRRWDDTLVTVVHVRDQPGIYSRLRHGFAQGPSVVRYVDRVLQRYAAYRRKFPALTSPSMAMIADIASR